MATRLSFTEMLVWHAITGRIHGGIVRTTDKLIAQEVALSPSTVRDIRRGLEASGLIECSAAEDGELVIVLPEKVAVP